MLGMTCKLHVHIGNQHLALCSSQGTLGIYKVRRALGVKELLGVACTLPRNPN
jgi:hypothetical protein